MIQRELWQVQLGSSKDEVMFRKGIPTNKWAGDYWTYQGSNNEPRVSVSFHNSKVDAVFIEQSNAISVNGVFVGTPVEVLEARLGKPSKQIDSDDSRGRTYQYDAFNSIFFLSLGKVTTIGIMDRNAANK